MDVSGALNEMDPFLCCFGGCAVHKVGSSEF